MAQQGASQKLNSDQFLKVPQEPEEDSWISGEELLTEGSSDEDNKKKQSKSSKRLKNRANKSMNSLNQRRFTLPQSFPRNLEKESVSDGEDGASSAAKSPGRRSVGSLDMSTAWRPKRGSLKLPDLYSDYDEGDFDGDLDLFFCPDVPIMNVDEYLNNNERQEKIQSIRLNIQNLEKRINETDNMLQNAQKERLQLKIDDQDESSENITDNNVFFLQNDIDNEEDESPTELKSKSDVKTENGFIKRNIELAAKAMTKLPLTDEEKEKLEKILSETDFDDLVDDQPEDFNTAGLEEDNDEGCEEPVIDKNAYRISEEEKQRIEEINSKLQEFLNPDQTSENDSSKPDELSGSVSKLWTNLVLEQALKTVNAKLAKLTESNLIENDKQTESEVTE